MSRREIWIYVLESESDACAVLSGTKEKKVYLFDALKIMLYLISCFGNE